MLPSSKAVALGIRITLSPIWKRSISLPRPTTVPDTADPRT